MALAFASISALPNLRSFRNGVKPHHDHLRIAATRHLPRATGAVIALTREVGKNEKLANALAGISPTVELPCVSTEELEAGIARLTEVLTITNTNNIPQEDTWMIVTSPESARIVIKCWKKAGKPALKNVCSIGGGTSEIFLRNDIAIAFTPTISTFKQLAAQLPTTSYRNVIYPVSSKASPNNVQLLVDRGFNVQRINTYTTETRALSAAELAAAERVDVVTFASPTTVKGWCMNRNLDLDIGRGNSCKQQLHMPVACIGETSAAAARKAGFTNVFYPDKPGMKGWISAIEDAKVMVRERRKESI